MTYREFRANGGLEDLVACSWERSAASGERPAILPDGCADLIWRDGELIAVGPDTGAFHTSEPVRDVVGLRFRPGAAAAALGHPASDLLGVRVPLAELWGGEARALQERLGVASDARERRAILGRAVLAARARRPDADGLVLAASRRLGKPGTRVGELADALGIGERQLLRRFRAAVGYGPKTLDRILRFQRFLAAAPAVRAGRDGLARVAADLGYADQAHLTRECVRLAGVSPGALTRPRPRSNGDCARPPTGARRGR